jgi:O-antigen/teichoic acid export membrane protein
VLGRFLSDAEFGVVSATLIVIGLARLLQGGFGPALVQREDLQPVHVRSAFALCLWTTVGLVSGIWVLAPAVAEFFRMDADVMRAMTLLLVCQLPGMVPEALLQRGMNMRVIAMAEIASMSLAYVPIGIGCAIFGLGVWARSGTSGRCCPTSRPAGRCCTSAAASWPQRWATTRLRKATSSWSAAGSR